MTQDDVLAMEAGRELDVLVAERVMRTPVVATHWPCGHDPECGYYGASSFLPAIGSWFDERGPVTAGDGHWPPVVVDDLIIASVEPVPLYTTEIAEAWDVFESALISHGAASIHADMEDYGRGALFGGGAERVVTVRVGLDTEVTVTAPVCEAICKAAVIAALVAA